MGTLEPSAVSHPVSGASPVPDDAVLVERVQHGEQAAFDQLVRRHQQLVYAVALRMLSHPEDAKDVAQDAFVRAYRAIGTFRAEAKFSTWLVSIVMNLCRNRRRSWARLRRHEAGSVDELLQDEERSVISLAADSLPRPDEMMKQSELRVQLVGALAQLDHDGREVVVLRDVYGWSYDAVAQAVGCELGTVKSRLNRARLKLRALLNGKV